MPDTSRHVTACGALLAAGPPDEKRGSLRPGGTHDRDGEPSHHDPACQCRVAFALAWKAPQEILTVTERCADHMSPRTSLTGSSRGPSTNPSSSGRCSSPVIHMRYDTAPGKCVRRLIHELIRLHPSHFIASQVHTGVIREEIHQDLPAHRVFQCAALYRSGGPQSERATPDSAPPSRPGTSHFRADPTRSA